MKIVIDAGHGPETPGKRTPDGSMREFHFNSVVANYMKTELEQYENIQILFTHDSNRDVPLKERTDNANKWGANLFVSVHANAFGSGWNTAQGIETFVYTTKPKEAYSLAAYVQSELIRSMNRSNRGVKTKNFHVLRETNMTSILVECGFMTNLEEAALLKTEEYRKKCAKAIVAGIVQQYKLRKKTEKRFVEGDTSITYKEKSLNGIIIEGLSYVPVRELSQLLGLSVKWNEETKTVELK